METAARLVLGAHFAFGREPTPIELCLNPDGLCVPAAYRVDECHVYADIEATVDGIPIPRVTGGGWSTVPLFQPLPSGGNGHGCFFPSFELEHFGERGMSRTQELTIRVGSASATAIASDWLVERTISAPATFPRGTDVFVGVEPRVGAEQRQEKSQGTYILYDDPENDLAWFRVKYPTLDCCSSPGISDVNPDSWSDEGFVFRVPTDLPIGTGRFGFNEAWLSVAVTDCPFAACEVTVNRSAEVPVSVVDRPE
jgi:hypothetical protein